jgi:hypothetical protein
VNARMMTALLLAAALAGCINPKKNVVIVEKKLTYFGSSSTAVPEEFGRNAIAQQTIFVIEGKVRNAGEEDLKDVLITFSVKEAQDRRSLTARIPLIKPGETVSFTTDRLESRLGLVLDETESPEIYVGR